MSANRAIAYMLALSVLALVSVGACVGVVAWQARAEARQLIAGISK